MYSRQIKTTQQRLTQLTNDALYPQGCSWAEIATFVRSNPQIEHYTLSDIEDKMGAKRDAILEDVLRLSMQPYHLLETTFEVIDENQEHQILSLSDYQHCVLTGGVTTATGRYIDAETIKRDATIHLHVIH